MLTELLFELHVAATPDKLNKVRTNPFSAFGVERGWGERVSVVRLPQIHMQWKNTKPLQHSRGRGVRRWQLVSHGSEASGTCILSFYQQLPCDLEKVGYPFTVKQNVP